MTRRRRHRLTSRLRFAASHHFTVLLNSLQLELTRAGGLQKSAFPVLEKLAGIVGENNILEAIRWQQAGVIRLVEAESDRRTHGLPSQPRRSMMMSPVTNDENLPVTSSSTSTESLCGSSKLNGLSTNSLSFFEVMPMRASYNSYYLLPNVNYCTCKYFQKQVIKRKNRITCAHFLAVWLSQCLNSYAHVIMRKKTIEMVARNIVSRSQEFY